MCIPLQCDIRFIHSILLYDCIEWPWPQNPLWKITHILQFMFEGRHAQFFPLKWFQSFHHMLLPLNVIISFIHFSSWINNGIFVRKLRNLKIKKKRKNNLFRKYWSVGPSEMWWGCARAVNERTHFEMTVWVPSYQFMLSQYFSAVSIFFVMVLTLVPNVHRNV